MLAQFLEYARGFWEEQMQTVNLKLLLLEAVVISSVDTSTKIECPAEMHVILKHSAALWGVSNLVINASSHNIPPIKKERSAEIEF